MRFRTYAATTLRKQTQTVKQLADTNIGGARAFIETGKKKLDSRSQNVLTEVEKLLDIVEGMKDDVTKRQITPKEQLVKSIKKDQEEFLNDLIEDHKSAVEVYGHIEKVISLRGSKLNGAIKSRALPRQKSFQGVQSDDGPGNLGNVMMEIRGAAIDPEKRMKAIEASQKNREKELAARSDELQAELSEFVGQKKLKMTGGAEEADRVRQKRSDATLRAMFNAGNSASAPPLPDIPWTPPAAM